MSPLQLVNLPALMAETEGRSDVVIGLIDGPVEMSHPDLQGAKIETIASLSQAATCEVNSSEACHHGTCIAGILCAKRGSEAPAICPGCTVLLRPIFCEVTTTNQPSCPEVTPTEVAIALRETVNAGAKIINLSMGLSTPALLDQPELKASIDYACRKEVVLVVASGNQGRIGQVPLFNHEWVIPVAACDPDGRLEPSSNIGPSVGKRGLMAPGLEIVSTSAMGGYTTSRGTNVAAPFVTGTIALLWSLMPNRSAAEMRRAILLPGLSRKTINPPLLDAKASWQQLNAS